MTKRFFVYSPDLGIEWVDTAKEAKSRAEEELKQYRKDAKFDGEWPDEVEHIRWGEVKGRTVGVPCADGGFDYALKGATP